MRIQFQHQLGLLALFMLTSSSLMATAVNTDSFRPYVIGSQIANQTEWAVQVVSSRRGICTGTAINTHYILTARHCVSAAQIEIHYSQDKNNVVGTTGYQVDLKNVRIPKNPHYYIAILPLINNHPLTNYAKLDRSYIYPGQAGKAAIKHEEAITYGYGPHKEVKNLPAKELYASSVAILRQQDLDYSVVGIITMGLNGPWSSGDSGGPLLVNDKVAGVLHGALNLIPNIHNECVYTPLNTSDIEINWLDEVIGKDNS